MVFAEDGRIVEIQLHTPEMHEHAENGIAAHWSYSESNKNKKHFANLKEAEWIAKLKNWLKDSDNQELYQSLRTNFFSDRVFVLTPKGEVKDLLEGSTMKELKINVLEIKKQPTPERKGRSATGFNGQPRSIKKTFSETKLEQKYFWH